MSDHGGQLTQGRHAHDAREFQLSLPKFVPRLPVLQHEICGGSDRRDTQGTIGERHPSPNITRRKQ